MDEIEANKIKNKFLDYCMSIRSRNQYNLSDESTKQIELEFSIAFSSIIDGFVDKNNKNIIISSKKVYNVGRMWDGTYDYCFNVPKKLNIKSMIIELND